MRKGHAFVHVREIGTPVNIFGMVVNEGDLVHADRHGALVIPPEVIPDLQAAIEKLPSASDMALLSGNPPSLGVGWMSNALEKKANARVKKC